jgi:hypothetical protein
MVAVAVVALAMGGLVLGRRRAAFWAESVNHAKLEQQFRNNMVELERVARAKPEFAEELAKNLDYQHRRVAYHALLKSKYRSAMDRPWEAPAPDPPPPSWP